MIDITAHSHSRIKQRCGKSMDRIATIAFNRGLTHSETSRILRQYISSLCDYNGEANNIRLYGDKTYIFCNEVLVTVYNTPKKYLPIVRKLMNRREYG